VTLISLSEGEKLAGIERIEERDLGANGNGGHGGNGDAHEEPPAPPSDSGPTVH
jgi:hypothetical protein